MVISVIPYEILLSRIVGGVGMTSGRRQSFREERYPDRSQFLCIGCHLSWEIEWNLYSLLLICQSFCRLSVASAHPTPKDLQLRCVYFAFASFLAASQIGDEHLSFLSCWVGLIKAPTVHNFQSKFIILMTRVRPFPISSWSRKVELELRNSSCWNNKTRLRRFQHCSRCGVISRFLSWGTSWCLVLVSFMLGQLLVCWWCGRR